MRGILQVGSQINKANDSKTKIPENRVNKKSQVPSHFWHIKKHQVHWALEYLSLTIS